MTYKELKEQIDKLTPEQLNEQVKVIDQTGMENISQLWCLEDDYINPSGDGIEPKSVYKDDPEFADIYESEPVILPKGTLLLMAE
jgi:hypothetical protein